MKFVEFDGAKVGATAGAVVGSMMPWIVKIVDLQECVACTKRNALVRARHIYV